MNGKKTKNFVKQKIRKPIFPIVGISGSNGSLEAAKDFFSNVPHKCGIAFVFVQHRDTVEQGLIDVHIAKYTSMPVKIVADGTPIKPDQIYIIPPLSKVVIKNDHFLTIASTVNPENTKRPIDTFFKSLAKNNGDKSGCVILSGSSDSGILGLKAIKRHRGLTAVQTPNSAKYEKMPQSAINSGLIDHIDISHKLPSILINYFNQKLKQTKPSILHQLNKLLKSADIITNAAMWLAVHQTYSNNVYLDGRELEAVDFKQDPQGHLGGSLNMIPAYMGYMLANALTGFTRSWVMGQGHAVAAIDSVNLLKFNTQYLPTA